MTSFEGFTSQDFDVFTIPGLEPRMEALITHVRPKLTVLGELLAPYMSVICREEMFPHVAKHARRTINAPNDTWVAWAPNKKGYKAHPHFQVGLWSTHLFAQFALIYESEQKPAFAAALERNWPELSKQIPGHYVWSLDHMQPEGIPHSGLDDEQAAVIIRKLKEVKKSEALLGIHIDRSDPVLSNGDQLLERFEQTFRALVPFYDLARGK